MPLTVRVTNGRLVRVVFIVSLKVSAVKYTLVAGREPLLPEAAQAGNVTAVISATEGSENDAVISYPNRPVGKLSPVITIVVDSSTAERVAEPTVTVVASAGTASMQRQSPIISILIIVLLFIVIPPLQEKPWILIWGTIRPSHAKILLIFYYLSSYINDRVNVA